jgi:hypothetical protein
MKARYVQTIAGGMMTAALGLAIAGCEDSRPVLDMKGVKPGINEQELKAKIPVLCSAIAGESGKRECTFALLSTPPNEWQTYAQQRADTWIFTLFDDRLGAVQVLVYASPFDIIEPLKARFGEPAIEKNPQQASWAGKNGTLRILGVGPHLSLVSLSTAKAEKREGEGVKARSAARAKDT